MPNKIQLTLFVLFLVSGLSLGIRGQNLKPELLFETERGGGGGCDPYFQVTYLIDEIEKHPGSSGLVVVYDGGNDQRLGNLKAFTRNANLYVTSFLKYSSGKIKFTVGAGKSFFFEQLWLIPQGVAPPVIEPSTSNIDSIADRYHFSNSCLMCEPSYPWLTRFQPDFEDYVDILKGHPEYLGVIDVGNFTDLMTVRRKLTRELKLSRNRYRIHLIKSADEESLAIDLYLMPKSKEGKQAIILKSQTNVSN